MQWVLVTVRVLLFAHGVYLEDADGRHADTVLQHDMMKICNG